MLTLAGRWFPIVDGLHAGPEVADQILRNRFCLQGEEHVMAPGFDWKQNPSHDLEWLILLHKFYYAVALGEAWARSGDGRYVECWMELTSAWMEQVEVDFLPADVAGRRLQNWISAWHYFADAPAVTDSFRARFLASVEEQASWLRANLTPARNHRTLELLALFMTAVAMPELPQAAEWMAFAREAIVENLCEDFRADGVHREQSSDYHHIVLRNGLLVKQLAELNGIGMPAGFDEVLQRALEFALYVHRPDGQIPALSDGDTSSFLPLLELGYKFFGDERYLYVATQGASGRAPQERLKAFPDGGYYILRSGWGEREKFSAERYLVFDCGPLGDGNHGHLDLLHFELYGFGLPLVVDPGRYTYDESGETNWRVHFRGTAAHNTVCVDGRNQTKYAFHKRKFKILGEAPAFELLGFGERDGYDFVHGRAASKEYDVVHEREIRMIDGRQFLVLDSLHSPSEHRYTQSFQLTAAAEGRTQVNGRGVKAPHLIFGQELAAEMAAAVAVVPGWVSPVYGSRQAAPRVEFSQTGKNVRFATRIEVKA